MIPRTIAKELAPMLSWFPVVSVTGPWQSGKSALVKTLLPHYEYDTRQRNGRSCGIHPLAREQAHHR